MKRLTFALAVAVMQPEERFALELRFAGLADGCLREYRFHPKRRWRLDFAWPDMKIAVEVHGKVWGGRHTHATGFTRDREKMNEAACLGWTVLELTTDHVTSGKGIRWLERLIRTTIEAPRKPAPTSSRERSRG